MNFNIKIPAKLRQAYLEEINSYQKAIREGELTVAWKHLERSHIIGQSYPFEHSYSHWLMLKFGLRQQNTREVFGQVIRLAAGGWKSFIDHVPLGNTGGSDVPPLRVMSIPDDIQALFAKSKTD